MTSTNNDLKQLTYTTSHDLRSPVNNLLAVLDLIDLSKITDDEASQLVRIVKMSGDYLKETLDNYVDALSEKHHKLAPLEVVNLGKCLSKVLKSIQSLIETYQVALHFDFSKVENIRFNDAYMESVFLNLITNSIKYARPDTPSAIHIHSEEIDGRHQVIF